MVIINMFWVYLIFYTQNNYSYDYYDDLRYIYI